MSSNKYKILLVEDDRKIRALVQTMLETADYQVIPAETCAVALSLYASYVPDLIILDLGLPDQDGACLLKSVRETSLVPIIILSARFEDKDKVEALDMGANDYVSKPFSSAELLARVRSALRSSIQNQAANGGIFRLRDLTIHYAARQVFLGEREIRLTQTEYNILSFLSRHSGKMMTYYAIIRAVWGPPDDGSIKKLQVNMANIRKKLGVKPGSAAYVINELGVGYRMENDRPEK